MLTRWEDATTYNNFYEFGTSKIEPARTADTLETSPCSVTVEGECKKPGQFALEGILASHVVEERISRLHCVKGWSMAIPWLGVQLSNVLKRVQPTSNARSVRFETLLDPEQLPGQKRNVLHWPYVEGLRMDEATHPLTLLVSGMYSGYRIRMVLGCV